MIYARRSQVQQDASVETQVEEATRFIATKGWKLVDTYRDDDKNTGRREFVKRRAFNQLISDATEGKFDIVVVRDKTRLGGDTARTILAVEGLKDEGVSVWYYISDTLVRLDNWIEKVAFAIQSAASEGERDGISSRVFEALMVKARSGYNAGGSCFGYDNAPIFEGSVKKRTEYKINKRQAEIVRRIFRRYADGDGLRSIAKGLNAEGIPAPQAGRRGTGSWSLSVIRPMLLRERYVGRVVYGRTKKTYKKGTKVRLLRGDADVVRADVPHLQIVPTDLWEAVQARFKTNERKPWRLTPGRKPRYLLSRLARCSACGGPIHGKASKRGTMRSDVYLCGYYQDRAACKNSLRRPVADIDARCIGWIQDQLLCEKVVLEILAEVRRRVAEHSKDSGAEVAPVEQRATALRREISNLVEAIALTNGSVGELAAKLAERQGLLTIIESRISVLKAAPEVFSVEVDRLEVGVRSRLARLNDFLKRDTEEARKVIESCSTGRCNSPPSRPEQGGGTRLRGR